MPRLSRPVKSPKIIPCPNQQLGPHQRKHKWFNDLRFEGCTPTDIWNPRRIPNVRWILKKAIDHKQRVRAVGAGHSCSDVAITDGYLVDTFAMKGIKHLKPKDRAERFKKAFGKQNFESQRPEPKHLVEVQGGSTIKYIHKKLERMGLALENMGTYTGQTFMGAMSTSTHGSGVGLPPFPDMVKSIVLATIVKNPNAGEARKTPLVPRVFRIEPSSGVTLKSWFDAGGDPEIDELIHDDDLFYSVICSMGCMGILCSAIIQVRDMYWLEEIAPLTTWNEFKSGEAGLLKSFVKGNAKNQWLYPERHRHVELIVGPVVKKKSFLVKKDYKGENLVCVTLRRECAAGGKRPGNNWKNFKKGAAVVVGKLQDAEYARLHLPKTHDSSNIFKLLSGKGAGNVGAKGAAHGKFNPNSPYQVDWEHMVKRDKYQKIFYKGLKTFGGSGIEISAPVNMLGSVMDKINEVAEASLGKAKWKPGPVGVRFVKESKAYLSPQYGRDTVMFETTVLAGSRTTDSYLRDMEKQILKAFSAKKYNNSVRVHWGLERKQIKKDQLVNWYPKLYEWLEAYKYFNPRGHFDNEFTKRLGLRNLKAKKVMVRKR